MSPEVVKRYSSPVPRYTSYPTAPHFSDAIGPEQYAAWLAALPERAEISLYLHIPFCSSLCWYCGCSTKAVRRYEPVSRYLAALGSEMANVAARLPRTHIASHVHWGGGSPNILNAGDIVALAEATRRHFNVADNAEFAVEIDPRALSPEQAGAFANLTVKKIPNAVLNRCEFGKDDYSLQVSSLPVATGGDASAGEIASAPTGRRNDWVAGHRDGARAGRRRKAGDAPSLPFGEEE